MTTRLRGRSALTPFMSTARRRATDENGSRGYGASGGASSSGIAKVHCPASAIACHAPGRLCRARCRRKPRSRERRRKPQINRLFCKPICKPDAARQLETGETEPTKRDGICPIRRGHCTRERQPETAETCVVWLITQRPQETRAGASVISLRVGAADDDRRGDGSADWLRSECLVMPDTCPGRPTARRLA